MSRDRAESTEEVEHDPGFIAVLIASIEGIWTEGPWYRIGLLLLAAVVLAALIFSSMVISLGVVPL